VIDADQQTIVDWFDWTYSTKGTRYLRPVEAYFVYLELLEVSAGDRLLDVACGLGNLLQAGREYTPLLHGIDISTVAAERASGAVPGADIIVGNAEALPYADRSFDVVTCLGSLERMLDVAQALREIRRVGKENARYCFLVRNSNTYSWKHLAQILAKQRHLGHAGADEVDSWAALFRRCGFAVIDVLPDQYPLHRRRRWASLFTRPVDFRRPVHTTAPLDRANEFVFVLRRV
jgi:SAM-dependent methyltransferase